MEESHGGRARVDSATCIEILYKMRNSSSFLWNYVQRNGPFSEVVVTLFAGNVLNIFRGLFGKLDIHGKTIIAGGVLTKVF